MMHLSKIYLRPIGGGTWRKIGKDCDCDVTIGWWSDDSKTIYFNEGVKATNQLMSIDVASGKVTQLTHELASVNVSRDEATGRVLVNYSDPVTPPAVFAAPSLAQVPTKASWIQLTRPNPQVDSFALGDETEITWKSKGRHAGRWCARETGGLQGGHTISAHCRDPRRAGCRRSAHV